MAKEKKELGFKDRNNILKTFKVTGKNGWIHLQIAQSKLDGKKFLRLKKYLNWFSIKNSADLARVERLLQKGNDELGWNSEESIEVEIAEELYTLGELTPPNLHYSSEIDVSDEVIELFEENPEIIEKLISLKIQGYDFDYLFDILNVFDNVLISTNERLRTAFKEIVEKIAVEDTKGMQELSDLMGKYNLYQITTIMNLVKYRLETIETLDNMILNEKTYEIKTDDSIHRLLEKNMWLIDEQYWIAQSNKSLRTFIGDEIDKKHKKYAKKRPDFACVDFEGRLIILELKRPSVSLKKEELDQAELYLRIIKNYQSEKYRSINVVLIGNKISSEAREIIENRKNVEIKTYQEFLSKTKKRYQQYLKAIEDRESSN